MSKNDVKIKKLVLRILLISLTFLLSLVILFSSFCSLSIYKFENAIIIGNQNLYGKTYVNAGFCINWFTPFEELAKAFRNKKYIILLQNNYEIRASGGFMGSYAILNFGSTGLEDWKVENIYVPDGQLKGHVAPILPIQQAFRTGDWRLRDSNWEIDFPKAASDIQWFFDKGGEKNIDGIIAINFGLIQKLIGILGSIHIIDFNETVDSRNIYTFTQTYSENNSFPGSTQKQSFLNSLGTNLIEKTLHSNIFTKVKITTMIYQELNHGQIYVWIADYKLEQKIYDVGWDGSLPTYNFDFLYPVESNLGANKANCCINRSIIHQVNIDKNKAKSQVSLLWKNNSEYPEPTPPSFWGGNYKNYERIVIPKAASNILVIVNSKNYTEEKQNDILNSPKVENDFSFSVETYENFKIIGFWILVPATSSTQAIMSYELPLKHGQKTYEIKVKNQPGIYELPYKLMLNDKIIVMKSIIKEEIFKKNFDSLPNLRLF